MTYMVIISSVYATYRERWDAESKEDAEAKARQRWRREFGDAGAFHFYATPAPCARDDD